MTWYCWIGLVVVLLVLFAALRMSQRAEQHDPRPDAQDGTTLGRWQEGRR